MDMRRALKDKLANYKIPQELRAVEELPKNAMGKSQSSPPLAPVFVHADNVTVNKKSLVKEIFGDQA